MKISYIPNVSIDKQKWDRCIDTASNGVIYAYSFYLDAMSAGWDALVAGDYEIVMPLTWRKKYTIHYLYQPFFCAQLGIFGNAIDSNIVNSFLKNIPDKFKYWDFYLNKENLFLLQNFKLYERKNYILSLSNDYNVIQKNYAESHKRNIARAIKAGNTFKKNIPIDNIITLAFEQTKKISPITQNDYNNFAKLFSLLQSKQMATTFGVFNRLNQLMASCVFIFSHRRAYYILVGNHPDGRTSGASHLLIDGFIKENAGKNLTLDFEGSNINSLAFFYKSFGADLEKYPGIKLNKLPAVIKLFKQ